MTAISFIEPAAASPRPPRSAAMLLLGTFPPYLVLQVYAAVVCRGRWRAGALVPFAWMVPVGFVSAQALRQGSNLWPCALIPASVAGFVYLAVLTSVYQSPQTPAGVRDENRSAEQDIR